MAQFSQFKDGSIFSVLDFTVPRLAQLLQLFQTGAMFSVLDRHNVENSLTETSHHLFLKQITKLM